MSYPEQSEPRRKIVASGIASGVCIGKSTLAEVDNRDNIIFMLLQLREIRSVKFTSKIANSGAVVFAAPLSNFSRRFNMDRERASAF